MKTTCFRWGRGDDIITTKTDGVPLLHEFMWDECHDAIRPMMIAGHKVFNELAWSDDTEPDTLFRASSFLRHSMSNCCDRLDQSNQISWRLREACSIWHLIEIMTLHNEPFAVSIVPWVHEHFPRYPSDIWTLKLLHLKGDSFSLDIFWQVVYDDAVRGDLLHCWTVLKTHRRFGMKQQGNIESFYSDLGMVLLSMPRLQGTITGDATDASTGDIEIWTNSEVSSRLEFRNRFSYWSKQVATFSQDYDIVISEFDQNSLLLLLEMLAGNIGKCMDLLKPDDSSDDAPVTTWSHLVGAILLYCRPASNKVDLATLIDQCMQWAQVANAPTTNFDDIYQSIFAQDYLKVVQRIHSEIGDKWVDAHLTDILCRANLLESVSIKSSLNDLTVAPENFLIGGLELDIREHAIIQYAMQIGLGGRQSWRNAHSPVGWKIAADYLVSLDRTIVIPSTGTKMALGFQYMQLVVDKQQPISDKFCQSLLTTCKRMGIPYEDVIKERVVHWWRSKGGAIGDSDHSFSGAVNAVKWAKLSGEESLANSLLSKIFQSSSTVSLDILIKHLGSNDENLKFGDGVLTFLSHYKDLHSRLEEATSNLRNAVATDDPLVRESLLESSWRLRDSGAQFLCHILSGGGVPVRFYEPLLRKVFLWEIESDSSLLDLIECNPPFLDVAQISVLMTCLEESTILKRCLDSDTCINQFTTYIRLVLVQSLARAHMCENKESLSSQVL